jgi:hypothetical protein
VVKNRELVLATREHAFRDLLDALVRADNFRSRIMARSTLTPARIDRSSTEAVSCWDANQTNTDQDEHRIEQEADDRKSDREHAANASRDPGRTSSAQTDREHRAQHATAIHRKRGQQVERRTTLTHNSWLPGAAHRRRECRIGRPADRHDQREDDRETDVHRGACECDKQFLRRPIGHPIHLRDPTDRQQEDLARGASITPGDERVASSWSTMIANTSATSTTPNVASPGPDPPIT